MSRLERLKWIPLLIKAYSEVQVRRALEAQQNGQTIGEPPMFAIPAKELTKPKQSKPKKITKPVMKTNQKRPIFNKPKVHAPDYQLILRELKETQRKLNRLETTNKQLVDQIQTHFEQQLKQFTKKLEGQEKNEPTKLKPSGQQIQSFAPPFL